MLGAALLVAVSMVPAAAPAAALAPVDRRAEAATSPTTAAAHTVRASRLGPDIVGGLLVAVMLVGGIRTTVLLRRRRRDRP